MEIIYPLLALIAGMLGFVAWDTRRTFGYAYVNAMISAWEGRMLTPGKFAELRGQDLKGVLSSLSGTDYEVLSSREPGEWEKAVHEICIKRYLEIRENLPKKDRRLFDLLLERFDVFNLESLLTSIETGEPPALLPSLCPPDRLKLLKGARSVEELLEYLRGTPYEEPVRSSLEEYRRIGLRALFWALERHYYERLWAEARRRGRFVKELVGIEVELVNLKLMARMKREGMPPPRISELVIRPSFLLSARQMEQLINSPDLSSFFRQLGETPYREVAARAGPRVEATGSLLEFERELDKGLLRLCRLLAGRDFFSILPAVRYFYMKEAEARDLKALLVLKREGLTPEEIAPLLIH